MKQFTGRVGETDEAFAWLERGDRERDPLMIWAKAYPVFDPLRSDPRYRDLLRRIGFPEECTVKPTSFDDPAAKASQSNQ